MKKIFGIVILAVMVSCKSKAILAEGTAGKDLSAEKIIKSHYLTEKAFKTLNIQAAAKYKDSKMSQNVTADIRIKKDEKILVSIRFLGITMAKALITPTQVSYYEKLNGSYFEGDYTTLSRWLGTDLDFAKVQNLLIGKAMDNLAVAKYNASVEDGLYRLINISDKKTQKTFYFEADKFLIKRQEIEQQSQNRLLRVDYPSHRQYAELILPTALNIAATQNKSNTNINIDYTSITVDEDLSFPYSVPDGYERIYID